MQQWRIRVKGKQRQQVDVGLVVQAVLALGRQLRDEVQATAVDDEHETKPMPDAAELEAAP